MIKIARFISYSLFVIPLLLNCGINTAGGGVIVTNPYLFGTVRFPEGQGANEAMVIIGCNGVHGLVDTLIESQNEDFSIIYDIKIFDTTYCDLQGKFSFENVSPGPHVLVAQRKEVGMMSMTTVTCNFNDSLNVSLILEPAASISIEPYFLDSIEDNNFIAAQISGTAFMADYDDSIGTLIFDMVPAGEIELILFRKNNTIESYQGFNSVSGEKSILKVNPVRSTDYWTAIHSGPRDPLGSPYILSSSPEDEARSASVNQNPDRDYDVEIQFSHPMDSKLTNEALKVISSDSLTSLDTVWWQGGNLVYLRMCTKNGSGECSRGDSLYKPGVSYYVIVDTTAETSLGVKLPFPDTLTFLPKP